MDELLKKYKVIVCAGSGGVGKTTLAASLAVRAAQLGLKVLVLTIDPSLRLATSLGISTTDPNDVLVPNQDYSGKLFAAMLNSKKVFDDFVRRAVPDQQAAEKFMRNRLYAQLSTKLSGSQEFTALERLFASSQEGGYDLVILDTPPTKHAIDFLKAPQKLNSMFQKSITQWLVSTHQQSKSFFSRFSATQQVFNVFRKITGSNFIDELVEFFVGLESWQEKVQQRTVEVHKLLTGPQTAFVLVSGFNIDKLDEANYFYRELKKGGYRLAAIIINRAAPVEFKDQDLQIGPHVKSENQMIGEKMICYYKEYLAYFAARQKAYESFKALAEDNITFVRIPDFNQDVNNLRDLEKLAELTLKSEVKS